MLDPNFACTRAGAVAEGGAGRGAQHQGPALLHRACRLCAHLQVQVGPVRHAPAGAPAASCLSPSCLTYQLTARPAVMLTSKCKRPLSGMHLQGRCTDIVYPADISDMPRLAFLVFHKSSLCLSQLSSIVVQRCLMPLLSVLTSVVHKSVSHVEASSGNNVLPYTSSSHCLPALLYSELQEHPMNFGSMLPCMGA